MSEESSSSKNVVTVDPIRDMAAKIYIQLVSSQVSIQGENVKIGTNPDNLAKVSMKLAEAFDKVEKELTLARAPAFEAFDVNKMDFGL
jgi:hypothetical protein